MSTYRNMDSADSPAWLCLADYSYQSFKILDDIVYTVSVNVKWGMMMIFKKSIMYPDAAKVVGGLLAIVIPCLCYRFRVVRKVVFCILQYALHKLLDYIF